MMKAETMLSTRWCLLLALALALGGCEEKPQPQPETKPGAGATERSQPEREPDRDAALLLGQAQFLKQKSAGGRSKIVPGPAKLIFVYADGGRWTPEVLEDPDANVFHKVMPFDLPGERPGILTIGANMAPLPATLKIWRRTTDGWEGTLVWEAKFGGKFNRFRDIEIGDVTGDGKPDMVVATHDQGVVAVLQRKGDTWEPTQIDQRPNIFVHEIEIGDVDGDGRNEIFATPSAPNRADGTPQPGWVVMYRHEGDGFARRVVEEFDDRHVKEILLADLQGAGRPDLYAVLEGELVKRAGGDEKQVKIKRYHFAQGDTADSDTMDYVSETIATLPDKQCRFLNAGDVDGDGKPELIAAAYKSGLWMIKPEGQGWATELIDKDSGGYEHATALADMDGDGVLEIYAAADDQQQLRRYRWTGEKFERTDLFTLPKGNITFGLMPCLEAKYFTVQ